MLIARGAENKAPLILSLSKGEPRTIYQYLTSGVEALAEAPHVPR